MTYSVLNKKSLVQATPPPTRSTIAKLSAILDTTQDGILIADDKGRYVETNAAACRLLGMSRERIIGRLVEDFADPGRKQEVRANWRRLLRQGHQKGLFRIYRPDGNTCYVEYTAKAHIHPDQNLCILRDITERNQAERSLRARESRLRSEVAERKKIERALRTAKDAAEAAAQAKSQFLANISHEIRTPINGILGTLELLQQTFLTTEQKEYAEIMDDSGVTLIALVNELLDFARIEAGKLKLEIKNFDLLSTLDALMALFSQRIKFKKLQLFYKIDEDIPSRLRGDPLRLRQVLMNLIGNAIKFTQQGKVILKISKQKESDSEVTLRFSIQDTGPGISRDQQRFLFQPFSQLDNSAARTHRGTGLGLAISKQLIEHMAGAIGVRSSPGRGSTFWFSLPFERQAQANRSSEHRPARSNWHSQVSSHSPAHSLDKITTEKEKTGTHPRLLVVEDNRINRLVVVRQLEKLGYAPETVANGAEALDALRLSKYELVLMDCQMPVMDGYQATRAIRQREKGSHIPIIAMTAHAMEEDRQKCLAAGMDDYLSKPIPLERLAAILKQHLSSEVPVNLAQLKQTVPVKGNDFDQLVDLYEKDMASQLQEMEEAIQARAAEKVKALAHSALGASVLLGMQAIAEPLRRLEELGNQEEWAGATQSLERAKSEFERTRIYLSRFKKEAPC